MEPMEVLDLEVLEVVPVHAVKQEQKVPEVALDPMEKQESEENLEKA